MYRNEDSPSVPRSVKHLFACLYSSTLGQYFLYAFALATSLPRLISSQCLVTFYLNTFVETLRYSSRDVRYGGRFILQFAGTMSLLAEINAFQAMHYSI